MCVSFLRRAMAALAAPVLLALLALASAPSPSRAMSPAPPGTMSLLPGIPDTAEVWPFGMNNRGQVIGYYLIIDWDTFEFSYHGFVYDHGVYTTVEPPEAGSMLAWVQLADINDRGQIVGMAYDADFLGHAFLYDNGAYTPIDYPGSIPGSTSLNAINDRGQIVGSYVDSAFTVHAFRYDGGVYTTIDPPGATFALATDINERGQIVGYFLGLDASGQRKQYGFLWDKGDYTILKYPDLVPSPYTNGTAALRINDRGQIVGSYYQPGVGDRYFVYENGVYTAINIPGASYIVIAGINDRGQVAGYYGQNYQNHGFLWDKGVLTIVDGPAEADGTIVAGFNDAGEILGMYQLLGEEFFSNILFVIRP